MTDDRLRMTPGPTAVPAAVRERMSEPMPNPDVEPEFFAFYRDLLEKLEAIYGGDEIAILGGEGILGLEAAIASLVEPGDRVLCISNGLYGGGFADFVEMAGGEAVVCDAPWDEPLDLEAVEDHLAADSFDIATMVHCETPTGMLNDIEPVLEVLDDHDVISVVDAVSSLGGTPVPTDLIDVCLGASQKCFSAPPGLTVCSISDHAWDKIESFETPSLYTDLEPWRDAAEKEWFPYTHLVSNLYGFDTAIDLMLEEGLESVFERHETAAAHCRDRARELGLSLYPDEARSSPTVTALEVPGQAEAIQSAMADDHDIVLATGLGDLAADVLRVGHMGHNARIDRVDRTMDALAAVLE
ncbi:alanine--glyoxylate aminotransferase family protein [Haloterrigena sp. H1]|uniref:pyridoxal-phosphate-dependent aminotransferase family protein n=1 Tax=Haloterrigena sp. H1 TaxID=2552943 RepID=UPI00110DF1B6|nr:alanine--glyoxylate aminotransferase family protein [Haloterrigena sp. H1]TMT87221.1 alanine--glyoxylate aminotransferase family protein [Haloterrigena sp. H1]